MNLGVHVHYVYKFIFLHYLRSSIVGDKEMALPEDSAVGEVDREMAGLEDTDMVDEIEVSLHY